MTITYFCVILINGGCVTGPVQVFLLLYLGAYTYVGSGSSEMSLNISGFHEVLKNRLLMLR